MMTLKSVARPGAVAVTAVAAALTLGACSAGQVSQTAHQVAAVNGASADTDNGKVGVRDVTVVVSDDDPMADLKFTAINNDTDMKTYTLKSVTVDGQKVTLGDSPELARNCLLVADTLMQEDNLQVPENSCMYYTTANLKNTGFPVGGSVPVQFDFGDGTTVAVTAAVAEPVLKAGKVDRNYKGDHADSKEGH